MINAATQRLENLTDRKFVEQSWDIYLDQFPSKHKNIWWDGVREGAISELYAGASDKICLPFGLLKSVESFKTYDDDDNEYVFSSTNYSIDTVSPQGVIALKNGSVWPATVLRSVNGIKIEATFGFNIVPDDIKQAIKLTTGKLFENRGDDTSGEFFGVSGFTIPATAMALISPYARVKI